MSFSKLLSTLDNISVGVFWESGALQQHAINSTRTFVGFIWLLVHSHFSGRYHLQSQNKKWEKITLHFSLEIYHASFSEQAILQCAYTHDMTCVKVVKIQMTKRSTTIWQKPNQAFCLSKYLALNSISLSQPVFAKTSAILLKGKNEHKYTRATQPLLRNDIIRASASSPLSQENPSGLAIY